MSDQIQAWELKGEKFEIQGAKLSLANGTWGTVEENYTWTTYDTWKNPNMTRLRNSDPRPISGLIEESIADKDTRGLVEKIAYLEISPSTCVRLWLERKLKLRDFRQALEADRRITLNGISFGGQQWQLVINLDAVLGFAFYNTGGVQIL